MNECDPETGIVSYFHCVYCLSECPSGTSPADFAEISVGVSPQGDLIVWCNRHLFAVRNMKNEGIAHELQAIAGTECSCRTPKTERMH